MKKLLSFSIVVLALTLGTGSPAFADPAQVTDPPPATNEVLLPGKACVHANLDANRDFDSNHATGVDGIGTPPTCDDGGGGA